MEGSKVERVRELSCGEPDRFDEVGHLESSYKKRSASERGESKAEINRVRHLEAT
jgi:hypothetical protein